MLINALCEYYQVLAQKGRILPPNYSGVKVHYLITLTPDGLIDGIVDHQITEESVNAKGKKKSVVLAQVHAFPKRTEKTGIDGNRIEHRPTYIFGLNYDSKAGIFSPEDKTGKARKSHEAFVSTNLEFIEGLDSPLINAYRAFLNSWNPEEETENPHLLGIAKAYGTAGFAFCLSGEPEYLLQDEAQIKARWEELSTQPTGESADSACSQCAVTGKMAPIARIHSKIKGVPGGSSMGNTLISFNNEAEYSYGHEQSYNSNISQEAMMQYTEALNYLLSQQAHRTTLDDIAVVHWAASGESEYDQLMAQFVFSDNLDEKQTQVLMNGILSNAREGKLTFEGLEGIDNIDPNVTFYMVGFKPNSARLAVKFIYRKRFGTLLQNAAQHQADMMLDTTARPTPVWLLCKQLLNPKSRDEKVNPATLGKLLDAIFHGYNYPESILATVIRRIKADSDDDKNKYIKMNPVRMGIIKAYINRRARLNGQKEEIQMSLDMQSTNPAYLCGRLFAVLESIQLRAANYNLNRTIRDAYFASASSTPAVVFPKIMRLSQYHLSKIGNPKYATDSISEIVDMLGSEFPKTLSLVEQGKFMLGYYQQKSYTDRRIKEAVEAQEEN